MAALDDKERKKLFPSLAQVRNQKEYESRLKLYESSVESAQKSLDTIRPREEWNDKSCFDLIYDGNKRIIQCNLNCIEGLKKEWPIYKEKYLDEA